MQENNSKTSLQIILKTDQDDSRPIYISGNFNDWNTEDANFRLEKIEDNLYQYQFASDFDFPEELLYKFTKGDWNNVEVDANGERTENRSTRNHSGIQYEYVPKWKRNWSVFKPSHLPQIVLLSDEFEIPQLHKTRKIWALLPHDYDKSKENYPVIYMQDGQNLFNEAAKYGNWAIDKKLAIMAEYKNGGIIIIAIEHAEEERTMEYNVGNTVLGRGQGKEYIRFVTETLKPFVDSNFRTKPEREYTGIGGSSMGGLVSIFSGLRYPKVYGKLLVFSPLLWVLPKLRIDPNLVNKDNTKIYLYAGGDEGNKMVEHIENFKNEVISNEFVKDKLEINLSINMKENITKPIGEPSFRRQLNGYFLIQNNNDENNYN